AYPPAARADDGAQLGPHRQHHRQERARRHQWSVLRQGGDAFLVQGPVARARQARHYGELHSARAHHERADPAQLPAGIPQVAVRARNPGRRIRPARGSRQPGLLPCVAARALHYRRGHPRGWRFEEVPILKRLWLLALIFFFSPAGNSQNYPVKPIRLVVPFAPGGSSSIVARTIAAEMEKGLGQSIVIENKGGGGGNIA